MIYLVVGHPRTGTSMMMDALRCGGLPIAYSRARDQRHLWEDVNGYRVNPHSLYETPAAEVWMPGWPRKYDGKAMKCLVQWVRHLSVHEYTVLFMHRDHEEVRQSFKAAFRQDVSVNLIKRDEDDALRSLNNRLDVRGVTHLRYRDVLARPRQMLAQLAWPIDVDKASERVRAELCRFKSEELTPGL